MDKKKNVIANRAMQILDFVFYISEKKYTFITDKTAEFEPPMRRKLNFRLRN